MAFARAFSIPITTDASGDATAYTPVCNGPIQSIRYVKDGTAPFDNGVDFTITTETTAHDVWVETNVNASKTVAPRQATHGTDGAASLYAAAGTAVQDKVWAVDERIKIVIAQGGNVKVGTFHVIVGG